MRHSSLRLSRGFVALAFIAAAVPAMAHPHVWITYRIGFVFDGGGLTGFTEEWTFDQATSLQILQLFDTSGTGKIDAEDLPALKAGYFDDLRDYSYFSSIRVNGEDRSTQAPTNFSATYAAGRMIYRFFVPLVLRASATPQTVTVTIWDPTYFTDLGFERDRPLAVAGPSSITCRTTIETDPENRYHLPPDLFVSQAPPVDLKMAVVRFAISQ